jgi:hypothetical protein
MQAIRRPERHRRRGSSHRSEAGAWSQAGWHRWFQRAGILSNAGYNGCDVRGRTSRRSPADGPTTSKSVRPGSCIPRLQASGRRRASSLGLNRWNAAGSECRSVRCDGSTLVRALTRLLEDLAAGHYQASVPVKGRGEAHHNRCRARRGDT